MQMPYIHNHFPDVRKMVGIGNGMTYWEYTPEVVQARPLGSISGQPLCHILSSPPLLIVQRFLVWVWTAATQSYCSLIYWRPIRSRHPGLDPGSPNIANAGRLLVKPAMTAGVWTVATQKNKKFEYKIFRDIFSILVYNTIERQRCLYDKCPATLESRSLMKSALPLQE